MLMHGESVSTDREDRRGNETKKEGNEEARCTYEEDGYKRLPQLQKMKQITSSSKSSRGPRQIGQCLFHKKKKIRGAALEDIRRRLLDGPYAPQVLRGPESGQAHGH